MDFHDCRSLADSEGILKANTKNGCYLSGSLEALPGISMAGGKDCKMTDISILYLPESLKIGNGDGVST